MTPISLPIINSLGNNSLYDRLTNLSKSNLQNLLDPRNYEGFSVKIGVTTGSDGILSGVLGQKDYELFINTVKNINIKDASFNEMNKIYMTLLDAKLIDYGQVDSDFRGSSEFSSDGSQINRDVKYNQWEFWQEQLPSYNLPETAPFREKAINAFKLLAAVAHASPITGITVAKESLSPQDKATANSDGSYYIDFSERAKRLARGENPDEVYASEEMDIAELIMRLEKMEKAQRAAKEGEAKKAEEAPGEPVSARIPNK